MITGKSVRLVPFDSDHLAQLRGWMNDPEIFSLLGRSCPVSDVEHSRWFESQQGRQDRIFFAIEKAESKKYLGNVWFWDIDWRHRKAEIRIVIGSASEQNSGSGSEALALAANYAFMQLNLHKLYAYVLTGNERAKRSFEKSDFHLEAILKSDRWIHGDYVDVLILSRFSDEITSATTHKR